MGYIGMCGPKGYGFSAVLVINSVIQSAPSPHLSMTLSANEFLGNTLHSQLLSSISVHIHVYGCHQILSGMAKWGEALNKRLRPNPGHS